MEDNIIKKQIEAYQSNFLSNQDNQLGTYQTEITQNIRFEHLIKNIYLDNDKIHDVGCGTCDLHHFLNKKKIKHEYIGTEIVPEMIEYARSKYPKIKIHNRDLLKIKNEEIFDYSFLSGTFNIPGKIDAKKWGDFCYRIIEKMFATSKKGIVFNFITSHTTFKDPQLFYLDPALVFKFCVENLSRFVHLSHSSPLYEYTITVFKKDYVKSKNTSKPLNKYFK